MGYDADAMAVATATPTARRRCGWCSSRASTSAGSSSSRTTRQPQGARARGQPARGAPVPLAAAGPPGARGGPGGRDGPRRGRGVRAQPLARQSQLSALASPQSRRSRVASGSSGAWPSSTREYAGPRAAGRASDWGGFRLEPEAWEFWQHARPGSTTASAIRRDGGGWRIERLAPLAVREGLDRDAVVVLAHAELVGGAARRRAAATGGSPSRSTVSVHVGDRAVDGVVLASRRGRRRPSRRSRSRGALHRRRARRCPLPGQRELAAVGRLAHLDARGPSRRARAARRRARARRSRSTAS